ncbi:hypothetical protein C8J56DRAFT_400622 [Mycena floridula]|nr:hypothetical protein C8J56DRAFT_400622 [Mycena floridula]
MEVSIRFHEDHVADPAELRVEGAAADVSVSVSDTTKFVVTTTLGYIPYLGAVIPGLVGLLWPGPGQSLREQVRAEVEALIDQKIDEAVFNLLSGKLQAGLGEASKLYVRLLDTQAY